MPHPLKCTVDNSKLIHSQVSNTSVSKIFNRELYLKEFDRKVESNIAAMERYKKHLMLSITRICTKEMMKLPKEIRDMNLDEYVASGGDISIPEMKEVDILLEDFAKEGLKIATHTTSTKSKKLKMPARSSKGKVKIKASINKQSTQMCPLNKSSESKIGKSKNSNSLQMSSNSGIVASFHTPSTCAHPVSVSTTFTPKFDPRLPITPAQGLRKLRAGEKVVMMSMDGSPLINSVDESDLATIMIPTNDGKTMAIAANVDASKLNLDEDMKIRVRDLQKKLSAIVVGIA